jgi:hypothetical protein
VHSYEVRAYWVHCLVRCWQAVQQHARQHSCDIMSLAAACTAMRWVALKLPAAAACALLDMMRHMLADYKQPSWLCDCG